MQNTIECDLHPPGEAYIATPDKRLGPYTSWVAASIAAWELGLKDFNIETEPNF